MKKVFLVAAAFIFGSAAYAQTTTTTSSEMRTRFGLKAGVNLPKYKFENDNSSTESETSTNFHVTGYADIPVSTGFSFQPGISLQGKGGKVTTDVGEFEDNVLSIDIPLNMVGHIPAGPGNFFIGAGPYVGFNVAGEREATGTPFGIVDGKEDLEFGNDSGDNLKPIDFGINALVGYQFNTGFNIGAGYGFGLSNLIPDSDPDGTTKINNRVLSFSIGYAF